MSRTHRQAGFTYPVPGQVRPLSEQQATALWLSADDQLVSTHLGTYPRRITYSTIRSLIDRGLLTEGEPERVTVNVYRYRLTAAGQAAGEALPPLWGIR